MRRLIGLAVVALMAGMSLGATVNGPIKIAGKVSVATAGAGGGGGGGVGGGGGAGGFNFDLTQSTLPAGLTATRTGGTIYAARSSGTAAVSVTGADVFESRVDGDGHWVFAGYTNHAPSATDFSTGAGWQYTNSPTFTANAGTDPTGGGAAAKFLANGSTNSYIYDVASGSAVSGSHQDNIASIWVKDAPGAAPSTPGAIYALNNPPQGYSSSYGLKRPLIAGFGSGSGWRRATAVLPTAGGTMGIYQLGFSPAGSTPVFDAYNTATPSATGGVLVWGAEEHVSAIDYPLVIGSTGSCLITADSSVLSAIPDPGNGDIDIDLAFIAQYVLGGAANANDGWIFSMQTPGAGTIGVSSASNAWAAMIGGTAYATHNYGTPPVAPLNGGGGGEVGLRFVYRASTTTAYVKATYNGCFEAITTQTIPGIVAGTPTSFYLGSNLGSNIYDRIYTRLKSHPASEFSTINNAEGAIIGDSTSASYSTVLSTVGSWIYSLAESRSRRGIASLAVTGQTIAQQLTVWQASALRGDANLKWVYISLGINDINSSRTEAQMKSDMNALIADINTNNPTAKILIAPMLPFGFTSTQLTTWNAFNSDITGTGVTGSNLIRMPVWSALDDGTGTLKVQYQYSDGQHENDPARQYIGAAVRTTLQANSLL